MSGKIIITPRSLSATGHPALQTLTEKGYELVFPSPGRTPMASELQSVIPDCVGWLAGVEPISAKLLCDARNLKVISRNGVGVNNVDIAAAAAKGIVVERTAGANARGVAELAITLMLCGFRHVPWSHGCLRDGRWERRIGVEAKDRTLGVIGCGAIGRTVAQLAIGLGMKVIGYDPFPFEAFAPEGFRYVTLDEIMTQADAISLHCPPAEQPLIDADALKKVSPGAVIVNTARAELVDEMAILSALEDGQVATYATDVYRTEPPEMSPLLEHDRVILMPHAGGFTRESVNRATEGAVANILNVLEGSP